MRHVHKFVKDEKGATAIEYGLIAALISVAIIGAVTSLGSGMSDNYEYMNESIEGVRATSDR